MASLGYNTLFYLVCMLSVIPLKAKAEIVTWKEPKYWDVSFYPSESGCQLFRKYGNGTLVWLGFTGPDGSKNLRIDLAHDDLWSKVEVGKEYSFKVYFGDEDPLVVDMKGKEFRGVNGFTFVFDKSDELAQEFIAQFMRHSSMEWYYGNYLVGHYHLKGSRGAFNELLACQKYVDEKGRLPSNAQNIPFKGLDIHPFAQ